VYGANLLWLVGQDARRPQRVCEVMPATFEFARQATVDRMGTRGEEIRQRAALTQM
jgi:hypothetical protein